MLRQEENVTFRFGQGVGKLSPQLLRLQVDGAGSVKVQMGVGPDLGVGVEAGGVNWLLQQETATFYLVTSQ